MSKKTQFATDVIHAGQACEPHTGAVIPPIYATSTFANPHGDSAQAYTYGRCHNPTRFALEQMMMRLENGIGALAFASGMAAITAVTELLQPGDEVLVHADIYEWDLAIVRASQSTFQWYMLSVYQFTGYRRA